MSRWSDRYSNHQFFADWAAFKQILGTIAPPAEDPQAVQEVARMHKVVGYVDTLLKKLDPELWGLNFVSAAHGSLTNAVSELSNYPTNQNQHHLSNANNFLDSMMLSVQQQPLAPVFPGAKATQGAAESYTAFVQLHIGKFEGLLTAFKETLQAQQDALESRSTELSRRLDKLEATAERMASEFQSILARFNSDFQASENSRKELYEAQSTFFKDRADRQIADSAALFAAGHSALGSALESAGKVLGSIIDTSQAGAYAQYASEEKKSANLYRYLALGLMCAAALVLFLPELVNAAKAVSQYTIDWKAALHRLPFSVILFAPAYYLTRESSRHRNNEILNRRRQHILTTIGPYLALLDKKRAEEIKADVAKSIFSDALPTLDDKSPETTNVLAQVTNLVDLIVKKAK